MSTPSGELPTSHPAAQIAGRQSALQPGGEVPLAAPNNTLAVVSLVAGIASFFGHVIPFVGGFTLALVAIITGHIARNQIKRTGEAGIGLATAGLVIGYIHIALVAVVFVFFFGFVVAILTAVFSAAATGGG